MTPQELTKLYLAQGGEVKTPGGQQAFNQWADNMAHSQGVDSWAGITPNGATNVGSTGGGANPFAPGGTNTPVAPSTGPTPLNNTIDQSLLTGAAAAGNGGNTSQVQGGNQLGQFNSSGTQNQTSTQGQSTSGTQQQQQNTSGTTSNNGLTAGTSANFGSSTTGVNDTLGFGSLLKGAQGQAGATDANRTAYLTDLMSNGGSAFQDQVADATNKAMSGPGMQGVGQSAQARAVGYAVNDVARTNQDQRLQAAGQLAGPTATSSLASAANPYLGSTNSTSNMGTNVQGTSSTGSNDQSTSSTGSSTQDMTGFSNLLNKQDSSGTSAASNRQVAYGNTPQQSSSGGGGSVICTALGERGMLPKWMLENELIHVRRNWSKFKLAAKGYFTYGVPLAKLVRRSKLVAYLCLPMAKACAYEASRKSEQNPTLPFFVTPFVAYWSFLSVNSLIGLFVKGSPEIKDPEVKEMLENAGLSL